MVRTLIGKIVISVGLVLNVIGALLLTFSAISTKKKIANESRTYIGKNPHLEKSLKLKSQIAKLAAPLLAFGFVLQLVGIGLDN